MGRLFRLTVKIGLLLGMIAVAARLLKLYQGSPEGVGEAGFTFDADDDPFAIDESTLGGDVNPELLERLVCPLDKGPLELEDGKWLVNPRNGYRYPITDGIPVMLVEVGERYRDEALIADAHAKAEVPALSGDDATPGDDPTADAESDTESDTVSDKDD